MHLQLLIIYIFAFLPNYCQIVKYYCNFDIDLTGDCIFNTPVAKWLFISNGKETTSSIPIQPLSDVTSILSLTTPMNESCILPYDSPMGNWSMYFCQRITPSNYTCPTESGTGNCVKGKYGLIRTNHDTINDTYFTNIETTPNTLHCLDFYYYLTDTLDDAKMSVGWEADGVTQSIVEVTALEENKWQHSRTTFTSPPSEVYEIWFRMMRKSTRFVTFTFALDEIKILENSCEYQPTTSIPNSDTTEVNVDYNNETLEVNESTSIGTSTTTAVPFNTSALSLTSEYESTIIKESTSKMIIATATSPPYESQTTINTQPTVEELKSTAFTDITMTTVTTMHTMTIPITTDDITVATISFTSPNTATKVTMETIPFVALNTTTMGTTPIVQFVVLNATMTNTIITTTLSITLVSTDLGLILGLSLGIGIPLIVIISYLVYYCRGNYNKPNKYRHHTMGVAIG